MTKYNCHHCRFSTTSFKQMAAHSRKKHPNIMKKRTKRSHKQQDKSTKALLKELLALLS
jgi:hypothetical protein